MDVAGINTPQNQIPEISSFQTSFNVLTDPQPIGCTRAKPPAVSRPSFPNEGKLGGSLSWLCLLLVAIKDILKSSFLFLVVRPGAPASSIQVVLLDYILLGLDGFGPVDQLPEPIRIVQFIRMIRRWTAQYAPGHLGETGDG